MSTSKELEELKTFMIETDKMINEFSDDEIHLVLRRIHSSVHRMRYLLQRKTAKKRAWIEKKKERQQSKENTHG